jgi:hypothetical protein
MAYLGSVSLVPPRDGLFLGNLSVGNLNLGANEVLYSSNGTDIDGSPNFTFDGTSKLHLGESLGFTNSYQTNIEAVTDANQSTQNIILQNKNAGAVASTNMYITNDSTVSESANFCVIGMNGNNYTGSNTVSDGKNQMYIANTNKDIAIATNFIGSGAGIHLSGNGGVSAISINPSNAISLGSTYNATTDTYSYITGTAGQVLTSGGSGGLPTWTTPTTSAITVSNQANDRVITATAVNDALTAESNLTFNGSARLGIGTIYVHTAGGATEVIQMNETASVVGAANVAIGHKCVAANSCTTLGYEIGRTGMSGTYNVLVGRSTATALTSGNGNVVIGGNAAQALTSGTNNVILGVSSGVGQTTQSNNTICGYNSRCTDTLAVSRANCGIFGDAIIGVLTGDNEIQIGKSTTTVYTYASATRSDARDKADIKPEPLGLNFIEKLKPVQYKWNYREDYKVQNEDGTISQLPNDGSKKRSRDHNGFLAQDIKDTMTELNIDWAGLKHGVVGGGTDVYNIDYSEFIAPLVKAIQQLQERIKILETK